MDANPNGFIPTIGPEGLAALGSVPVFESAVVAARHGLRCAEAVLGAIADGRAEVIPDECEIVSINLGDQNDGTAEITMVVKATVQEK